MSSYCEVVLPSPALEEVFHLEGTEELWHSHEEKPRETPAGESLWLSGAPCKSASLGRETSWQVCPAGARHTLA